MVTREKAALARAIQSAGSMRKFAAALGIKHQAVSRWQRAPAERVVEIERLTGVPRWELRPDLYIGIDTNLWSEWLDWRQRSK